MQDPQVFPMWLGALRKARRMGHPCGDGAPGRTSRARRLSHALEAMGEMLAVCVVWGSCAGAWTFRAVSRWGRKLSAPGDPLRHVQQLKNEQVGMYTGPCVGYPYF